MTEPLNERQLKAVMRIRGDEFGTTRTVDLERELDLRRYSFFDVSAEKLQEYCSLGCEYAVFLWNSRMQGRLERSPIWCAKVSGKTCITIGEVERNYYNAAENRISFFPYRTFDILRKPSKFCFLSRLVLGIPIRLSGLVPSIKRIRTNRKRLI